MAGNDRFNHEATEWDTNPTVREASEKALQAILAAHPALAVQHNQGTTPTSGPDMLEIGCGTGLLTIPLAPYARSITAVDAAPGMIAALQHKLAAPEAPRNVNPIALLLVDPEDASLPPAHDGPGRLKFDLILSHLVLHHIADLSAMLKTLHGCLKHGGMLALTDFENFGPDAHKFHPQHKLGGVERHGVQAAWFANLLVQMGFVDVDVRPAWSVTKPIERWPGTETIAPSMGQTIMFVLSGDARGAATMIRGGRAPPW